MRRGGHGFEAEGIVTREEKLAKKRAYAKQVYEERKARQVCARCEAGLQDDDGTFCVECSERDLTGKRRRARSEEGRQLERARSDRDRQRRLERGVCMYCTQPRVEGQKRCQQHVEMNRGWQKAYRTRKAAGIRVEIARKPISLSATEAHPYKPLDELEISMRVRLLRSLRWRDWSSTMDLFDAMNVDQDANSTERNSAQVALGRLVKSGLVDRRVPPGQRVGADYKITAAGCTEVERLRSGDLNRRVA